MKKLILLLLFIPILSFGQTWKFSEGGSAFDGKYKTSSITGTGTNFPYTSPTLVVNKFDGEDLNFYISNGGFFQEKTGISVLWVFDNEPNTVYSTYDWSISSDGKILFFREFNNPDGSGKLQPIELIEKLTVANKVTVRMKDDYGSNDIVFSLSGSTKAINFVLPKEDRSVMIEKAITERDALNETESKKQVVLDMLLNKAKEEMLSSSSLSMIESSFEKDLGMGYYNGMGSGDNYTSISVEGKIGDSMFENYGYVSVFYVLEDGSKKEVYGTWTVEKGAPVFQRMQEIKEKEEQRKALENEREAKLMNSLLEKYKRDDLISHLKENILEKSKSYSGKFSISDIDEVKIILSGFSYKKYWDCKVDIYLKNGEVKSIDNTYIYSSGRIELTKKDLKDLGGAEGTAF